MSPPILMPTAPRYLPLAQWTCAQIGIFWPEHPRIFFCGAEGDSRALVLRDDPADWMRVVHSACEDLLGQGYRQAYVILDDHPPIARCHAAHLATTLPEMAWELEMTSIVTGGYGPLNARKGTSFRWRELTPERLPISQPWKLPLHPALWNLERLLGILHHLMTHLPQADHNPWAFERIGSDPERGGVRKDWLSSCWRVNAWEMSTEEALGLHDFGDALQRRWERILGLGSRVFRRSNRKVSGLQHPRIGPYPCFWSGVMKKGRMNEDYVYYAEIKRRPQLVRNLRDAFSAVKG